MDRFINPVIYKQEHVEVNGVIRTGLYFQDELGRDWYETLTAWKGAVSLDSDGIVVAYEQDVSYMGMEEGRNVYEVDPLSVPVDVLGNYKYADGVFYDIRPDAVTLAEQKRKALLEEANVAMSPLQDAVDLDIATTEEKELLLAWKKYRVLLNRIAVKEAPDIDWPNTPQ
ncbi:TPA: tail fiber assembly protein [Enterobacter hormaechei subsp. xiangfangensis]|uniref:tail fiber assembly protein n=1 Tax=Enterobacter hormaechei TaxID=158836 RepID=UPI00103A0F2E|nr:tail fiber assembly protein [Enterobacter hormaechei]ELE9712422.1 tail fiber assembly protein [Enterobacter kobei]MCU3411576.1 tail fiber assembly protein [Enterobacter hormaechei subsp. steigerwaltii]EKS6583965.1 tail fiber assembly protein [Enterobacter hormaechei]ELC7457657.1 tail fiber assembly protein [Enterobacter hormaechei]MCO6016345.1 tail fiber assembly protein [Enterobacter hormaechei]